MAEVPSGVRHWRGVSRGRWEDDTLVVETSNFDGRASLFGSGPSPRIVERFTRLDATTLADFPVRLTVVPASGILVARSR